LPTATHVKYNFANGEKAQESRGRGSRPEGRKVSGETYVCRATQRAGEESRNRTVGKEAGEGGVSVDFNGPELAAALERLERRRHAYHEAGHAVVAWREAIRVIELTIRPDPKRLASSDYGSAGAIKISLDRSDYPDLDYNDIHEKNARIAMAGKISEQIGRGKLPIMLRYRWTDLESIQNTVSILFPSRASGEDTIAAWFKFQWLTTRDHLKQDWSKVEAVADALVDKETLTGAEVTDIIRRTGFGSPPVASDFRLQKKEETNANR
jgi:hypothetical protein